MTASAQAGVSIPAFEPDATRFNRRVASWAQWINQGHLKNVGNVTLAASTVSTEVADVRVSGNSFIQFMPMTADALSAQPTVRVSTIDAANGKFTITHSASGSVTKTFRYCLLG